MKNKKILIFYSSIWNWHISAANAIKDEILKQNKSVEIVLKNIRDFMNPVLKKIDEKLYWFIVKNMSESFDTLFLALQEKWNKVINLEDLPKDYPLDKVLSYIEEINPDTILSTHYWAAQVLAIFREKWLLLDKNIWWLHTDYFVGYFPRISNRIDKTFLAHPRLKDYWLDYGVYPDKVDVTWMPISFNIDFQKIDKTEVFKEFWLDTKKKTILLVWGKEWAIDYEKILNSITDNVKTSIQVVAVCGTNKDAKNKLENIKNVLPDYIDLKVFWLVKHEILLQVMNFVDVLITKPWWLTISEAVMFSVPMILVGNLGWHEKENAVFFSKEWLAKLCQDYEKVGYMVKKILLDERLRQTIIENQEKLRKEIKTSLIAKFALKAISPSKLLPADFWKLNWTKVKFVKEKLDLLDDLAPSELEIILSYSTSKTPQKIVWENPFWHLAIRIGSVVYSTNHHANPHIDDTFLQHMSLGNYLYWVKPVSPTMEHVSNFWLAYGRDSIWLRIHWIEKKSIWKMLEEIQKIEKEFKSGKLWNKYDFNCADVVLRILNAAGYNIKVITDILNAPTMPVDVFEQSYKFFSKQYNFSMVLYSKIVGAKSTYKFSQLPVSLYKISQIVDVLTKREIDKKIIFPVNFQLASFWDGRLVLEKLYNLWNKKEIPVLEEDFLKSLYNDIKSKLKNKLVDEKLESTYKKGLKYLEKRLGYFRD